MLNLGLSVFYKSNGSTYWSLINKISNVKLVSLSCCILYLFINSVLEAPAHKSVIVYQNKFSVDLINLCSFEAKTGKIEENELPWLCNRVPNTKWFSLSAI